MVSILPIFIPVASGNVSISTSRIWLQSKTQVIFCVPVCHESLKLGMEERQWVDNHRDSSGPRCGPLEQQRKTSPHGIIREVTAGKMVLWIKCLLLKSGNPVCITSAT